MKIAATFCVLFALLVAAGALSPLPSPPMSATMLDIPDHAGTHLLNKDEIKMVLCTSAGAQEPVGRKFLSAPAPGPMPHHAGATRDPKAADLLFVLSADQVNGKGPFRDGAVRSAHCMCSWNDCI